MVNGVICVLPIIGENHLLLVEVFHQRCSPRVYHFYFLLNLLSIVIDASHIFIIVFKKTF